VSKPAPKSTPPARDPDRLNGNGFNDRLSDQSFGPWSGDDVIKLGPGHRAARKGWHRLLCARIQKHNGQTLDELEGHMGWFYLSLTRNEGACVVQSAKRAGFIAPEDPHAADMSTIPDPRRCWVITDTGAKKAGTVDPRGGGLKDLVARIVPTARESYARAKAAIDIGGVILVGALGTNLAVHPGSLRAQLLVIVGVWAFFAALTWGAVSDERVLTAMARSWPRLRDYRPKRYAFETMTLRTPLPYAILAAATILAALAAAWALHHHHTISGTALNGTLVAVVALSGCAVALYRRTSDRAEQRRADYRQEYRKRLRSR
jgi:hypothetical protein